MTTTTSHTFDFGGEAISFAIDRTARRKTVAISVGYEGIRVLAPRDLDDDRIIGIVHKKGPWVIRKQAGYRELGSMPLLREFISGETFHYLGRAYRLKVIPDRGVKAARIIARGSALIASVPRDSRNLVRRATVKSGLRNWYCDHAKVHFPARARMIAERLDIPSPTISVVDQSKRWGSCDARGRIRLNWRLIMAPMSLVDYVIAHELCHLVEHNHSRRFWRSLETIMPDYEGRVHRLDRLGHLFVW